MIFVDASAMAAILLREPETEDLLQRLGQEASRVTSPMAIFEAALAVRRVFESTVEEARDDVHSFLEAAEIQVVSIEPADSETALSAFSRYGKGRGHPAQLNLGDCFAYAVAKRLKATLLFKGDDFTHTDIASALDLR